MAVPEEQERQKLLIFQLVFESDAGKKVLEDLKRFCHYSAPCFVQGAPDLTTLREGERNVILYILSLLERDPNEKRQETASNE